MNPRPLVRCRALSRRFGDAVTGTLALRPVDCEIFAGERIALMGPSGSGKSTLLHLIAGLDDPTEGTVSWPGIGERAALRPGPVAVVFQGPSLLPPLSALENVAMNLQLAGRSQREAISEARNALALLDLESLADKLPEELSGGQAQRVAIARAVATRPILILADEPTSQLDQANGARVVEVLLEAADAIGAAIVIATHDALIAERFAERWSVADGLVRTNPEVAAW